MTKSEAYIATIMGILGSGVVERGKVLSKFGKKWQVSDRTFDRAWKIAQERYKIAQLDIQKEVEATTIQQAKENALNGLKSKSERLMILQKQVDETLRELEIGTTEDTITLSGSVKKVTRKMTINEVTLLRRTLHLLQSEISKIEGDYAAVKQDVKVDDLRTWTINPK